MGDSMSTIINATTTNGVVIQPDNSGSLVLQTNSGTTALTIDTSQRAAFVAGTAALPAITTTGDTNTGIWFPAADTIAFAEGGAEAMRIDSSSNVGIGTNSPTAKLDVLGPGDGDVRIRAGSDTSLILSETTANYNWKLKPSAGDFVWQYSGTAYNSGYSALMLLTKTNGYLLVGYTSSNGAYKLQVNSQIFATSATIATSDARYKTNVEPISSALNLVTQLNPVQFDWKDHPVHNFPEGKTIGFLAQEIEEVLKDTDYVNNIVKANECTITPEEKDEEGNITQEAVKEEFLGIAEGNLIPLLTKAIQEQQTIINDLKARIETLEGAKLG